MRAQARQGPWTASARIGFGCVLLGIAAVGCSDRGGDHGSLAKGQLHEVRQLALEETDSAYIGSIFRENQISFSPKGRIAVGDVMTSRVLIFDADGTVDTVLGREGEGPGEFTRLYQVAWDSRDRLWAGELRGRFTIYSSSLALDTILSVRDQSVYGLQHASDRAVVSFKTHALEGLALRTYPLDGDQPLDSLFPYHSNARAPYVRSIYMPIYRVVGDTVIAATNFSYPLHLLSLDGDSIESFGTAPASIGTMRIPEYGEFADPRRAGTWQRSFGVVSSLWIAHDTLIMVQHRLHHPERPKNPEAPQWQFLADVYHRGTLRKLAEDIELPGLIVSTHDDLVWILTDRPPGTWTFTAFQLDVDSPHR
jgi:hypothetical protein